MPLHDYKCSDCGFVHEEIVSWDERFATCPACRSQSKRIYLSFNGIEHGAPDWMHDTLEVVDKDGGAHCQEFLRHPNRDNYKNWMKGEGLRPMEEGEMSVKRKKRDTAPIRKKVLEKFKKDNAIQVRGDA